MKSSSGAKSGFLHPIPKTQIPFGTIHIDHLGPFVCSKKKNTQLLVIVDGFTKFVFLEPVKSTKVRYVVRALEDFMFLFGVPSRIISDKGACFTSHTMKVFCLKYGIKHVQNAVATPRANGQCERYNHTILNSLRCLSADDPDETFWDTHIKLIQFSLNSSVNKTTGESPYKTLIGVNPKQLSDSKIIQQIGEEIARSDLQVLRDMVSRNISASQTKDAIRFNKKRVPPIQYSVGDLVMVLKTDNPATGGSRKLHPVFKGPFKILSVLPNDRYVLEDLRDNKKFKVVVAVDHMKPWVVLNSPQDQPFE